MTASLRLYVAALGATLLGQGLAAWALDASGAASNRLPYRFANSDPRHAAIHVAWGGAMLLLAARDRNPRVYAWTAVGFGLFYSGLAVLGLTVHHPLGLRLDRGENAFHLIVGPVTLALGMLALRGERVPA
jgi:hypothetical protein